MTLVVQDILNLEVSSHKVNFLFLVLQVTLENDQARFFFFFFFRKPKWKENGVQTAKCNVEGEVRGQDYKMQTIKSQKIEPLDGEATECKLCKHCGCMLITDYIGLHLRT